MPVLADSSAIIEFFRPGGREEIRQEVARLLDAGELSICGIVTAELLYGVREHERQPLLDFLKECENLPITETDYTHAGELGNSLRRKGFKVPVTDLLIASVAIRCKIPILTLDRKDFGTIPGIKFA